MIIGFLQAAQRLQTLDLSRNNIGVRGVKAIATVLRRDGNIEKVNLSFNPIGDEGKWQHSALHLKRTLPL